MRLHVAFYGGVLAGRVEGDGELEEAGGAFWGGEGAQFGVEGGGGGGELLSGDEGGGVGEDEG